MAANTRSFAQRMASMATTIENWDDEGDFDVSDNVFAASRASTIVSSRHSVRSELVRSVDEDWQVLIQPEDKSSHHHALQSAQQAGIPIPASVPSSALLGGTIKRLGKKESKKKITLDEDWGNDLELPVNAGEGLKLKAPTPRTPADDQDDFDDWGEGSLGIRFAGTRRDARGARSSSVSAMSPSLGSCMTLESEDDDLTGLVLPTEPLDFNARLEKLKRSEPALVPSQAPMPRPTPTSAPGSAFESLPDYASSPARAPDASPSPIVDTAPEKPKPVSEDDDFLDGLDLGAENAFDTKKHTLNRNVVVKKPVAKPAPPPAARPATTLTFTERAEKPSMSRIPRPLPSVNRTRLTPLYETGATQHTTNRPMPTTTSAQFLRAKRSAPVLRNVPVQSARSSVPFLPGGSSKALSHHVMSKTASQSQLRRDSDPRRPQSPTVRPWSRLSTAEPSGTPSRGATRKDVAPAAVRQPQRLTQPKGRRKDYGSGNELEIFDDLPTSATKEKQFEKAPRNMASNRTLRQQPSVPRLPFPDRMATPMPQTPLSPPKLDSTPRFARDTAASRNAREQRLAGLRPRGEGPIAPMNINWKVHVAAKSPHASPTAQRKRGTGQKPHLIQGSFLPSARVEKGMIYNPTLQRWEGNDEALAPFTHTNTSTTTLALTTASTPTFAPPGATLPHAHDRSHSISHTALSSIHAAQRNVSTRAVKVAPAQSPPRPALISQRTMPRNIQREGRMVFDPVKMTWLKAPRLSDDPRSPSVDVDDDEDPFAGLEDLKDNESVATHGASVAAGSGVGPHDEPSFIGEEFDLGPSFIRRQREEEAIWRRKTEGWVGAMRDNGEQRNGGYRWAIRTFAANASAAY